MSWGSSVKICVLLQQGDVQSCEARVGRFGEWCFIERQGNQRDFGCYWKDVRYDLLNGPFVYSFCSVVGFGAVLSC